MKKDSLKKIDTAEMINLMRDLRQLSNRVYKLCSTNEHIYSSHCQECLTQDYLKSDFRSALFVIFPSILEFMSTSAALIEMEALKKTDKTAFMIIKEFHEIAFINLNKVMREKFDGLFQKQS